jgi:mannose-6-phosphate isomerase-like protein (cupin superfamily)
MSGRTLRLTLTLTLTVSVGWGEERPALPTEEASGDDARMGRKLQDVLRAHGDDVHACWAEGLAERPGASGEILLRLYVTPAGSIDRVDLLKDQIGSDRLRHCLSGAIRRWKAPELGGTSIQQVVFPLVFKPDEPPAPGARLTHTVVRPADLLRAGDPSGIEAIYVIAGGLRMVARKGDVPAGAGDAILVPKGRERELETLGEGNVELVRVIVPGPGTLAEPALVRGTEATSYPILGGRGKATLLLDRSKDLIGDALALERLEADRGATVPLHVHEKSDELLYIATGRGTMTLDGKSVPVAAGDTIRIPMGKPHSLVVTEKLLAVQVYAPAGPEQRFKAKPPEKGKGGR